MAQLTDTHIVRHGGTYFGIETATYLTDAIAALHELEPRPDLVVVTGDLVNSGHDDEYERFAQVMSSLRVPYCVIPGNHDERDRMRANLPPVTYGGSNDGRVRYALDAYAVRLIGLDATGPRRWPGASFDSESLGWLEAALEAEPAKPTIVCVHQPPFRTGMHYMDALGFVGGRRFRRAIARHANVGLVLSGHIHCVRSARIGSAFAMSAPSTAPQLVPELFEHRAFGVRRELPGFAVHRWTATSGFRTTIYRRNESGRYVAGPAALGANGAA